MPSVTVPEKLYGSVSPAVFEETYSKLLSGLDVQLRFAGTTRHGWIMLEVSGEDETTGEIEFSDIFGCQKDKRLH